MKILYDISVLGLAHHYARARTGVFRVVENIARGLQDSPEIELSFCVDPELVQFCQDYLNDNPQFQNIPLYHSDFPEVDIFHSPFYEFLPEVKAKQRFLTVYDLIPFLFPHFFSDNDIYLLNQAIASVKLDDWVICISHSTKTDLCNYTQFNPERVVVTHLAATPDIFYPCTDMGKIRAVLSKYNIPDSPYILGVCTQEPRKNLDHVIRCFAKLAEGEEIQDLNLVLVGTKGWFYEKIFEEIDRQALLQNRIILTGYVNDGDLAALYSGALVFVYPSLYEGFGLPPLEAMQCGLPVITSNTSSLPEVVGDAGIMLDPTDTDGLCQSILEIYHQPSLREAMSLKSLKQAEEFSWERCIQETIAAYKTALASEKLLAPLSDSSPQVKILVDGVFFQLYQTGIARVWKSLLTEWVENGFAKYIVVLDRRGTAPKIPGIRYRLIPPYDYAKTDADRLLLQQVCNEEGADLFISTYYTTPLSTPSVFMAYDMIPEAGNLDLNQPCWKEKHHGIRHASAYITISHNTAGDLVKFFPHIAPHSVTVAYCGVARTFSPANLPELNHFTTKYGISQPYFILVGLVYGYKNTELFFQAFAKLANKQEFEIVYTGTHLSSAEDLSELRAYTPDNTVHVLQLSDRELRAAYSGAVALVYPSKYEGFGLPVLEALVCGCPVVTCPNASIPEVAGEAAIYVNDDDVDGFAHALGEVQKPDIRQSLIAAGLEQAKKFSWSKMAQTVSSALINATLLPLKLNEINLIVFPDWTQPEETLSRELSPVIGALVTHPDKSRITLLVYTGNSDEYANLVLSGVTMHLLMEEDLDVTDGPEFSLFSQLADIQWQALLPRLQARLPLEHEAEKAIGAKININENY